MSKVKIHPLRICGQGSYFVSEHYKTLASGEERLWSGHCRRHKTNKNLLTADEIREIYKVHSGKISQAPNSYNFNSRYGQRYDKEIGFWTQFWKEIFGKESEITPDFVKTLMMSESSFKPKVIAKTHDGSGDAIGLMQITEFTFKLLKEDKKELRDYYFNVSKENLDDPVVNICVGVRWLYRKHQIAKHYLKREPTELQIAEEYKGIRNDKSMRANKQREVFRKYQKELRDAKNKK